MDGKHGPPIDEAMMNAWMSGLAKCDDSRAAEMKRAINDWAGLDARIANADINGLRAIYTEFWNAPLYLDADGISAPIARGREPEITSLDPWYVRGSEEQHIMRPGSDY